MKTAFVSASYADRAALAPALAAIRAALAAGGYHPHVFIEMYTFAPQDARAMMTAALRDLRAAALLVAETTHKAIGVGVEVGAAAAWNIPIIAVRRSDAAPSTTVSGLADVTLTYSEADDLRAALAGALAALDE